EPENVLVCLEGGFVGLAGQADGDVRRPEIEYRRIGPQGVRTGGGTFGNKDIRIIDSEPAAPGDDAAAGDFHAAAGGRGLPVVDAQKNGVVGGVVHEGSGHRHRALVVVAGSVDGIGGPESDFRFAPDDGVDVPRIDEIAVDGEVAIDVEGAGGGGGEEGAVCLEGEIGDVDFAVDDFEKAVSAAAADGDVRIVAGRRRPGGVPENVERPAVGGKSGIVAGGGGSAYGEAVRDDKGVAESGDKPVQEFVAVPLEEYAALFQRDFDRRLIAEAFGGSIDMEFRTVADGEVDRSGDPVRGYCYSEMSG
ncbi:MAG: hypothetical protein LIQ30_04385, partial [Planctomycetes bacterium]|nr:hypothetical protein [Planctomycetota bacterium]